MAFFLQTILEIPSTCGNISHLRCHTALLCHRNEIVTSNYDKTFALLEGQGFADSLRASAKGGYLEGTHWAIPHDRCCGGQQLFIDCNRLGSNVQNHLVSWDLVHVAGKDCLARSQLSRQHDVNGKGHLASKVFSLGKDFLGGLKQVGLEQGSAHAPASCNQECVGNATPNNERVHALDQVVEQIQLRGHLGAADDGHQRTPGGI